jgi:predicted small lipoprotein YifL
LIPAREGGVFYVKKTICILLAALLLAAAVLSGCGKKGPDTGAPDPLTSPIDASDPASPFPEALSEAESLRASLEKDYVRGALTGDALNQLLTAGKDRVINCKSEADEDILVPAGDHSDKTVVFDTPNAGAVIEASLGNVIVNAMGERGIALRGAVQAVSVYGENVNLELAGGAETVYVMGKNCAVRLTGGVYGKICSLNQTVRIENATDAEVTVMMANGVPVAVPPGETLGF